MFEFPELYETEIAHFAAEHDTTPEDMIQAYRAMHQSVELQKVVNTLFKEMNTLNIGMDHTALVTLIHDSKDYDVWVGSALSNFTDFSRIPFNTKTKIQRDYNKAIQSRPSLFNRTYSGKTKKEYSKYLFDDTGFKSNTPEQELKLMRDGNTLSTSIAMQEHTGIQIVSYTGKDFSDGENQILNRFALVFEQAYTRFLDLQKAEEQAREAQIEAALERIRARALAMHNSDELIEVASVLRVQMGLLDQPELETSSVHLYNDVSKKIESWFAFRDPRKKKGAIKNGTASIKFDSSAVSRKWAKMYYSDLEE